jgi:hypothetical protein
MRAIKPASVSSKKMIPALASPVRKQPSQTSAHSTTNERNSSNSQMWPNKPKRVYEVIPRLTSESKKTSRQSSVGGQHEQIKITEIQSPQSPSGTMEKNMSQKSANLQLRGQYHYGPEAEEIVILSNDPENIDHQSALDDTREAGLYETLNTDQFLRTQSTAPHSRATIFVPEYSGDSQIGFHELTEDLIPNDKIDTNIARSSTATSSHELTSMKEINIQDTESLIQTAPEARIEPEVKPRIASRSTITPDELYHETETDLTNQNNPIISKAVKHSRPATTTPIATDDSQEKSSSSQLEIYDSNAIVPVPTDNNVSGLVAYFFSDYGNEGEGEEDLIPIDQNNFSVPTGADIIADDDINSSIMGQSQASLLILHSAHVPRQQQQQQQQQQFTSTMPLTIENNNEHIKVEEKKEIKSEETDATKKRIPTATSILPSSSHSPSPKQVLPISIIDDMQTQFTRNNNTNNDEHQRQPSTTPLNIHAVDSHLDEQERRSNTSQHRLPSSSLSSRMQSRIQSSTSGRNNEQIKNNDEEARFTSLSNTPLKSIDNENIQTPERIDSPDQRAKSSSRTLSRGLSAASHHTKKDDELIRHGSSRKSSGKNVDDENIQTPERIDSPDQRPKSSSRTLSRGLSAASHHTKKDDELIRHGSSRRSSGKNIDDENIQTPERIDSADQRPKSSSRTLSRGLSAVSHHTKNDNEPTRLDSSNGILARNIDRENSTSRRSIPRQPSITPSEQSHSSRRRSDSLHHSSNNPEIDQPFNTHLRGQSVTSHDDINKTPTNENEPHPFTVESEHFLHNQSQSPSDFNQRVPSGYSVSRHSDSRRSSSASSTLPVALDSPDTDNSQPPTSRTATPMRRDSISSIDLPPDPNILLTTTDEPNPDDPSVINSTIHFQMLSSQQPNTNMSSPERDEPSPLENIVPLQEYPTIKSPMEEHLRDPSPTVRYSPSDKIELEPENDLLPTSFESDVRVPSVSPSNHEQEEPIHETPSPSNTRHHQESSHQSPLLSYPARLEDLMRPTPSPFLSTDEHKNQEEDQNGRLSSVSPTTTETKKHNHHRIHQTSPPTFEHKNIRSSSSSPRHSEVSDTNHTSIEGEDTYRQQLNTPPISPRNEKKTISPDRENNIDITTTNNNHHQTLKRSSPLPLSPIETRLPVINHRQPSSEKSASPIHSQHEQEDDDQLHRNDMPLSSASIKYSKPHYSPPSSPPVSPKYSETELPSMTASQHHSKLSLRLRKQEPKRKKTVNDQLPSPQIDVGMPHERHSSPYSLHNFF